MGPRHIKTALAEPTWLDPKVTDISSISAERTAIEISKAGGCAQGIACDVLNESQQASALEQHLQAYGTLEAVCLNAGIAETGDFLDMNNASWLRTLDINLTAVLVGIRLAAAAMIQQKSKGATETP
ncbi:hypothetical protein WJX84_011382 [Apatococcus fuscideae]|uniref:Uncharacterized protein n=1 Tax=Apatococcus fuscideae TaxID=2026836 RepID=A0AAW1T857_9CHLO